MGLELEMNGTSTEHEWEKKSQIGNMEIIDESEDIERPHKCDQQRS